jgi:hypothetical protein
MVEDGGEGRGKKMREWKGREVEEGKSKSG